MGHSRGVLVLLAVTMGLAACAGKDGKSGNGGTLTEGVLTFPSFSPLRCLRDAGLSNAESRGRGFWRAEETNPVFVITVRRFSTSAEARSAVKHADRLIGKAAGRYAVLGPPKGTKGGGPDVELVAACFGSSSQ
jgi:hypothetical protein